MSLPVFLIPVPASNLIRTKTQLNCAKYKIYLVGINFLQIDISGLESSLYLAQLSCVFILIRLEHKA